MFAVIQANIFTFYCVFFLTEAVTENGSAPCFPKKTYERIRVNRATSEPIITKSFNLENSKKEVNSTEKESPVLIKSLNSEKTQKEDKSSLNKESSKANVTDSVVLISNPENSQTEGNSTEKESSKADLTDSSQITIKSLQLPKANLTYSARLIMESLNLENTKNDGGNLAEKESVIAANSSIPEKPKRDEKNATDRETSFVVRTLNSDNAKNEEEKSTDKEAVFLNKSSNPETTKEGNLTENYSFESNHTNSVQRLLKSSDLEQIKEINSTEKKIQIEDGNSTKKELKNENVTEFERILTKGSNYKNMKTEEGKLNEKEPVLKNLTTVSQNSTTMGKKSKIRRQADVSRLTAEEQDEAGRAFLTAYENCKLLKGKYFIRVSGSNPKKTKECVVKELRKLETYHNEFVQYLNNKAMIRKA